MTRVVVDVAESRGGGWVGAPPGVWRGPPGGRPPRRGGLRCRNRRSSTPRARPCSGAGSAGVRRHRLGPSGQAVRDRARRRADDRDRRRDRARRRDAARQPGDRGLRRSGSSREDRRRHLPGLAGRRRRRARGPPRRRRGGRALARRRRPARRRRGGAAGRLLLRRLPALRRDRPVRAGDGDWVDRCPRGPAGAGHLQRLPGAVRVAPAAGCADPQRPPQVRLPRPAARVENASTAWTSAYEVGQEIVVPLKNGEGGYVADERTLDQLEGRGRSSCATSATTPTGPTGTSPGSPTRAATSWA